MTTIMTVEDSGTVRDELATILRFEGYDVMEAEDGGVALSLLVERVPDLILCDLMMPRVDGYEVLRRVRSDPAHSSVPFVCLSARTERVDIARAMDAGASDYVTKPFTIDTLLSVIRDHLRSEPGGRESP